MSQRKINKKKDGPLRGSEPHTLPRFHLPLIEPDMQICRIRLSDQHPMRTLTSSQTVAAEAEAVGLLFNHARDFVEVSRS